MRICGSMKCPECRGRGKVHLGERHGEPAFDLCPVCKGNGVVPIYRFDEEPSAKAKPPSAESKPPIAN